ncbi:sensor histidine kinase [Paenibacillus kobensis]|uniref:sensor histidine kinase n=1 Tax=Paenibacillus kobensis TaxID=59841 RepID=UPI000FD8D4B9|nr:HAMP domain-containing sensor histidine kinase [Paenibacillus kobensis]
MSIRAKLHVALWAMVIVPNVIMVGLIVALIYLLNDQSLSELMNDEKNMEYRQAAVFGELSYVLQHEPDRLDDAQYRNDVQHRLEELSAGFVLAKEGSAPIVAPMLTDMRNVTDWGRWIDEAPDKMTIDGYLYQLHRLDVKYEDRTAAKAILLRQKGPLPIYWRVLAPLIGIAVLIATSIILTYFVSRSIIKPLYKLKTAAEQISEGRLDGQVRPTTKDEIGQLSETFETMRMRLKSSIEDRLQDEENRKLLLSHISHDLKTPITAIKGYVEGILDGVANTQEKQDKYLRTVYRKATDMDKLIDELFLFSKLDLHHVAYDFKPVDIRKFMAHYAEEQQFDLEKAGVRLSLSGLEGEPLNVAADLEKLSRVFQNIIGNSVKYMGDETEGQTREIAISLHAVDQEQRVRIEMRDNGPGVAPEALPKLFDQFYRTEQSRSIETGGSGLGLAIVKQIVEGHGGSVSAHLPPGGGLAITVELQRLADSTDIGKDRQVNTNR